MVVFISQLTEFWTFTHRLSWASTNTPQLSSSIAVSQSQPCLGGGCGSLNGIQGVARTLWVKLARGSWQRSWKILSTHSPCTILGIFTPSISHFHFLTQKIYSSLADHLRSFCKCKSWLQMTWKLQGHRVWSRTSSPLPGFGTFVKSLNLTEPLLFNPQDVGKNASPTPELFSGLDEATYMKGTAQRSTWRLLSLVVQSQVIRIADSKEHDRHSKGKVYFPALSTASRAFWKNAWVLWDSGQTLLVF